MTKYKEGNKFPVTLVITDVVEGDFYVDKDGCHDCDMEYDLRIEELGHTVIATEEELDAAFDPNYKERARLAKIKKLKKELRELENGG